MDFRHEEKYIVTDAQLTLLRARIRPLMQTDCHQCGTAGYRIRSVYFDDLDERFLAANFAGLDDRVKYRIRSYDLTDDFIRLETKYKHAGLSQKESCRLTRAECDGLLAGRYRSPSGDLQKPLRRLCLEGSTSTIRPRVIVEYFREAYVCRAGNVRVTFDRNIASSAYISRFFDADCPMTPSLPPHTHVLEVKYDEFLPDHLVQVMDLGDLMQAPFSKYVYSRMPL
ncbi:MAG: polyphosphate polymerase domain-containing protein [Christensenella sp.]|nr:polyphosphate polymerase domain-containing protein [Christensenella sp.]